MRYALERVEGFSFIGLPLRTDSKKEEADALIALHWERFFEEGILEKIPGRLDSQVLALYTGYEVIGDGPYTLLIGCVVQEGTKAPNGLEEVVVPESVYAVFESRANFPYSLIDTWKTVEAFPYKRRFTTDFEVYGENFQNRDAHLDVYIAVEEP